MPTGDLPTDINLGGKHLIWSEDNAKWLEDAPVNLDVGFPPLRLTLTGETPFLFLIELNNDSAGAGEDFLAMYNSGVMPPYSDDIWGGSGDGFVSYGMTSEIGEWSSEPAPVHRPFTEFDDSADQAALSRDKGFKAEEGFTPANGFRRMYGFTPENGF